MSTMEKFEVECFEHPKFELVIEVDQKEYSGVSILEENEIKSEFEDDIDIEDNFIQVKSEVRNNNESKIKDSATKIIYDCPLCTGNYAKKETVLNHIQTFHRISKKLPLKCGSCGFEVLKSFNIITKVQKPSNKVKIFTTPESAKSPKKILTSETQKSQKF